MINFLFLALDFSQSSTDQWRHRVTVTQKINLYNKFGINNLSCNLFFQFSAKSEIAVKFATTTPLTVNNIFL